MSPALSILAAAREVPERIALVAPTGAHSFAALAARVAPRAAALRGLDRLELTAPGDEPTVIEILAALEARVPLVLLHPRLTDGERDELRSASRQHALPEDTLAVCFTSGTIGRPRGALLPASALLAAAAASALRLGWREDDRWLLSLPLAHVGGLSVLVRCLVARRAIVLGPPAMIADPRAAITLASLVPAQLDRLLADPAFAPAPSLRALLLGGAAAPAPLLARAVQRGLPVLPTYGMTEACAQIATRPPDLAPLDPDDSAIGPTLASVELRISGSDSAILLRGPALFTGYLGEPSPLCADGWFDTGDLGALDARGWLRVIGRRDDLIITGGENVHPAEIERALLRCPGVTAACVVGLPDARYGQLVAAAVIVTDSNVTTTSVDTWARATLAPHRRPRRWLTLPALPLTPAGKLDRTAVAHALATVATVATES